MESFIKKEVSGNKFELVIDNEIYSKDIILKAAYQFLDIGYFLFRVTDDGNILLQFTPKQGVDKDPESVILDFTDELLNSYLRDKLEKENKTIRESIVKAAIGNSLDEKNFDVPVMEDNREKNQIDFDKDIDEILKEIENDPDLKIDEKEIENILKEIEEESVIENENAESITEDSCEDGEHNCSCGSKK